MSAWLEEKQSPHVETFGMKGSSNLAPHYEREGRLTVRLLNRCRSLAQHEVDGSTGLCVSSLLADDDIWCNDLQVGSPAKAV